MHQYIDIVVINLAHISQAQVPTSSASHQTVKKRTMQELNNLQSFVSPGDTLTQMSMQRHFSHKLGILESQFQLRML